VPGTEGRVTYDKPRAIISLAKAGRGRKRFLMFSTLLKTDFENQ
jgi:hypothetical protein